MRYVTAFFLLFFLTAFVSFACECAYIKSAIDAMNQAKFVFQGQLMQHEHSGNLRGGETVAYVKVDRVWKGIDQSEVLVYTDWSSCEFRFQDGRSYLFFAFEKNGKPYVYNCGKTEFLELAKDDIQELGQGRIPTQQVNLKFTFFWVAHFGVVYKTAFVMFIGILIYFLIRWRFLNRELVQQR